MSHYHYTDEVGDGLHVQQVTSGEFLVRVSHHTGKAAGICVPLEEAPAVALAILEAAGHPLRTYQPGEMRDLADVAHDSLKRHLAYQEEQAAREAEDLKVADFFTKFNGLTPAFINDHDRRRYRAARDFFEEKQ